VQIGNLRPIGNRPTKKKPRSLLPRKLGAFFLESNAPSTQLNPMLRLLDTLRHAARRRRWSPDQATGRRAEDLAHRFLQSQGYTIVARNYRLPSNDAEADLIAWEAKTLVIVEVKSRRTEDFGPPERAFDADKQRQVQKAARQYARRAGVPIEQVRHDLVTVLLSNPPKITLFRGATAQPINS
jgi:putative endonuclease